MAVRRSQGIRPDVREALIQDHTNTILKWAIELDADDQIQRSTAWIAAVRRGVPLQVPWWTLPEGIFPRGRHHPNDQVDIDANGVITWSDERDSRLKR